MRAAAAKWACCLLRQFPSTRSTLPSLIPASICMHQYPYSTKSSEENVLSTQQQNEQSRSRHRLPQQTDLLDIYRGLVITGRIQYDEDQIRVIMELRRLQKTFQAYSPPVFASQYYLSQGKGRPSQDTSQSKKDNEPWYNASSTEGSVKNIHAIMKTRSLSEELADLRTPKGLLLIGSPGCGKSFLIDLWLSTIPTPYKVRKHYNELVLEIYRGVWEESKMRTARLHALPIAQVEDSMEIPWTKSLRDRWRSLLKSSSLSSSESHKVPRTYFSHPTDPPIPFVIAHRLILQNWLLVFDELQLLDVSSAGLLSDVLSWFWRMGGVVVATSNKVPDDLYRNGVQRERLEPFVEALKARCPVLVMRGEKDWRRKRQTDDKASTWFTFKHEDAFEQAVAKVTVDRTTSSNCFNVFGRQLIVPWSSGEACKFTFAQLCEESLGPADYLTIASNYQIVIITDIPVLLVTAKNQSRRFISFIDALYEARCRVIALAESMPDGLFFPDAVQFGSAQDASTMHWHQDQFMAEAISEAHETFRPNVLSYENAPELPAASSLSLNSLSIFSGEEERFAYRRALSRLIEMTSTEYAETEIWNPLAPKIRKWESDLPATISTTSVTSQARQRQEGLQEGDFASEAAFESDARAYRVAKEQPSAPRLKEDHIWGVREDWGPKAGTWGRGAKVHRNDERPEGNDHDADADPKK